jgi:hypothetical protein
MVGRKFDVLYDDFSGGHFVGAVGTHQPRNTFTGINIGTDVYDGTLAPLEDVFPILTDLAATDAANVCSKPIWWNTNRIMWAGSTNVYLITVFTGAAPTLANVATPAAVRPNVQPVLFNGEILYPAQSSATLIRQAFSGLTTVVASNALPAVLFQLIVWGQFVLGVGSGNKVYFSNPGVSTVWTSTDFFTIGEPFTAIGPWCVHQNNLFISTNTGWWVASGIPGATLTLRQITTITRVAAAASIDTTVVTVPGNSQTFDLEGQQGLHSVSAVVQELAGNSTRSMNWGVSPDGRPATAMTDLVRVGFHLVARSIFNAGTVSDEGGGTTALGTTIWILNTHNGVWTRRQVTVQTPNQLGVALQNTDVMFFRSGVDATNPSSTENMWFCHLSPAGLVNTTFNSSNLPNTPVTTLPPRTAELAEYFHTSQFRVTEVLCEVDYGATYNTAPEQSLLRSISVAVRASSAPIERGSSLSLSRAVSSTLKHVLPPLGGVRPPATPRINMPNATTRRSWVRFNPTDVNDSFTASPIVTLQNVKLRRLIMRCEEVG